MDTNSKYYNSITVYESILEYLSCCRSTFGWTDLWHDQNQHLYMNPNIFLNFFYIIQKYKTEKNINRILYFLMLI